MMMIEQSHSGKNMAKQIIGVAMMVAACTASSLGSDLPSSPGADKFQVLLQRAGEQMSEYVERFSDVRCSEKVIQEKFKNNGGSNSKDKDRNKDQVVLKEESSYDYLVILTNAGGELSLSESRLPVHEAKADKKKRSLLVSNGFATLFLVFHPLYAHSFEFRELEDELVDGQRLTRIAFHHVRGMRSPAALALRGREYPLELSGTAWMNPDTAALVRISASIDNTLADVGLNTFQTDVKFAPFPFHDQNKSYWFPSRAVVEVETPRQHWRNTHEFTNYKRFSVSTEEQVINK